MFVYALLARIILYITVFSETAASTAIVEIVVTLSVD